MRILIDIGHPGHVHLFRPFANVMIADGHQVLFTCREKEFEIELLKAFGFNYISFGKKYRSLAGKIFGILKFDILEIAAAIKFKPHFFLSHGSPYAAHASFVMRKPHVSLEDSGNWEQVKIYLPFTEVVLTPDVLEEDLGSKQIKYSGYHEIAYLHPKYFSQAQNIHKLLNLKDNERYVLIRLVSWNATHDKGQSGIRSDEVEEIINYLSPTYRIFISSEGQLPAHLEKYKVSISPENMHEVIAGAELFVGEGATMASEAGVLGVPSVYVNSIRRSYNEDQEKYGLVTNFRNGKGVLNKIKEIESMPERKKIFKERSQKLLKSKINVTDFLVWFIKNYPESRSILKKDPDYQLKFR